MSNEELVEEIKQGINVTSNLENLYMNNKRYIYKIANRYKARADIEDLMQEAYFGLYEAVQHYECTQNVLFLTYAGFWIRQSMVIYIKNNGRCIRIPSKLQERMGEYKKVVDTFNIQSNRNPTDLEICSCLKIGIVALKAIKDSINLYDDLDSLDRTLTSEDNSMTLEDAIKCDCNVEDEVVERIMHDRTRLELWEIVAGNTTERENDVIRDRYIGNMTLAAVGRKLGVTREGIRQVELKAMRKLRRPSVTRVIKEKFEINYARAYRGSVGQFNHTWTSSTEYAALMNLEAKEY